MSSEETAGPPADLRSKFYRYLLAEGCDFNHNVKAMAVEMAYMAEHHYGLRVSVTSEREETK